ncbi:unnamed protein product, partial [Trichogramma brassicae]
MKSHFKSRIKLLMFTANVYFAHLLVDCYHHRHIYSHFIQRLQKRMYCCLLSNQDSELCTTISYRLRQIVLRLKVVESKYRKQNMLNVSDGLRIDDTRAAFHAYVLL